jgi:ATP-binding cassette subfamily B multidrug efflux pump
VGYIGMFWAPIANIGNFYNAIINATAYLERIFEMMDERPTIKDRPNATELPLIKGKVEFKDVIFGYDEGQKILENINFSVNPGDTIALVGATGSGKTTIVSLLSRFYDISGGRIDMDGVDINSVTIASLRKQMGVMLQDPFIFSGTIMDNIRYGRLDASDEEVMEAAKAVQAHPFITGLSEGYQTEVNERGTRLSTGQRQLISFARALLADPKILILDEATSSIDTETELALQKGLEVLLAGRTSFIIAHRLSTIQNATRILVIDKGQIIEDGAHEELMMKKSYYWKLHHAQHHSLEVS